MSTSEAQAEVYEAGEYSDQQLIDYLARRLAWQADFDTGLLEDPERQTALLPTFLSDGYPLRLGRRWERISDAAIHETRRRTALFARWYHVAIFSLMVVAGAWGEGYYENGFAWILISITLFIVLSPVVPWFFFLLPGRLLADDMERKVGPPRASRAQPGLLSWYLREPAIRVVTPSFLVAAVGLLGAAVAIEHGVHGVIHEGQAAFQKGEKIAPYVKDALEPGSGRAWLWIRQGRAELALSAVLGLAAYMIEHVLENLSITRDKLSDAARDAAAASSQASNASEVIGQTTRELESSLDLARVTAAANYKNLQASDQFGRFVSLSALASKLIFDGYDGLTKGRDQASIGLGLAKDVTGRRLNEFVGILGGLLGTISNLLTKPQDKNELQYLYRTNLLITAFESSIESQEQLFRKAGQNGGHFEVVAPFEALALTVSKFINAVQEAPAYAGDAMRARKIVFYTVLPIKPTEFIERAYWEENPLQPNARPALKAREWCSFLADSARAAAENNPAVVRHFLCVDRKLIDKLAEQYEGSLKCLRGNKRWEPDEKHPAPHPWNPLALESHRFTLDTEGIEKSFRDLFLVPGKRKAASPWKAKEVAVEEDGQGVGDGPKDPADAEKNTKVWVADIRPEREEGSVSLGQALYRYHVTKDVDEHGRALRLMKVPLTDWELDENTGGRPKVGSPLSSLMEKRDGEWVLVDHFAARIQDGDAAFWAFSIQSLFNPDMGVVKMRLLTPDQDDWANETVPKLNRLFGLEEEDRSHIGVVDRTTGTVRWPVE